MRIAGLLEVLIPAPTDAVIVRPASDHSYREARAEVTKAIYNHSTGKYSEYYKGMSLASDEEIVNVVVIY